MNAPAHRYRKPARAIACAAGLLLAAPIAALATPAGADDPVQRLLAERGLTPPPSSASGGPASTPSLARHVRDKAAEMVQTAMNFVGVPYRRGGDNFESGFDCSGFTRHVFETSLGLVLPRRSHDQARASGLQAVKRNELQPGDLVFFNTLKRTFSHVGIYVGDDKFIHAPRSGAQVRVEDMRLAYWSRRYNGARRADGVDGPATDSAPTRPGAPPADRIETRPAMHFEQWGSTPVAPSR